MQRRQKEADAAIEAQWAGGAGSLHSDYDPDASACEDFVKATRETEELYNAIVRNNVAEVGPHSGIPRKSRKPNHQSASRLLNPNPMLVNVQVYQKIEDGADVNFVFGSAYSCPEGYTALMVAAHRGRVECAKALLRAGANPNYVNKAGG